MSAAPSFGELRSLMAQPPSRLVWGQLTALLDAALLRWPHEVEQAWVPYALRALERWPDALRVCPVSWRAPLELGRALPTLRLVRLWHGAGQELGPSAARHMARCQELEALQALDLSRNPLGLEGVAWLLGSTTLRALRALELGRVLPDARGGAPALRLALPRLQALGLSHQPLPRPLLLALCFGPAAHPLRALDLSYTTLDAQGLRMLGQGSAAAALEHLDLSGLGLDASALRALASGGLGPGLRGLALNDNPIQAQGVEALLESARSLHRLHLAHAGLDAAAILRLARSGLPLRFLDLSHNPGLHSAQALQALAQLPALERVALSGAPSDALHALRQASPLLHLRLQDRLPTPAIMRWAQPVGGATPDALGAGDSR